MRCGGKVQNVFDPPDGTADKPVNCRAQIMVNDLHPLLLALPYREIGQAVEVAAGVQAIQRHDLPIGIAKDMLANVMADEASTARNENPHHTMSCSTE